MKNSRYPHSSQAIGRVSRIVALVAISALITSLSVKAATFTWDGDSGLNNAWSTGGNWVNGTAPTSGDSALFTDVGATASSVTAEVTANTTIQTLAFTGLSETAQQTIQINENITLSLLTTSGSGKILSVGLYTSGSASFATEAVFTGAGTLSVTGTTRTISITNTNAAAILDLSGLANFDANVSALRVAAQPDIDPSAPDNLRGRIILAQNSNITATDIVLGQGSATSDNPIAYMDLGQTTVLNVANLNVGASKSRGYIAFQDAVENGSLTIRGIDGVSAATQWNIGYSSTSGSTATLGDVDLTGGQVDADVDDLRVGYGSSNSSGNVTGSLTYDGGTIAANELNVGYQYGNAVSVNTNRVAGTLTIDGDAELNVNNLYIGRSRLDTSVRTVTGLLVVDGGEVTVDDIAVIGETATPSATIASVTGELRINGGSVTINAASGLQAGAETANTSSQSILTLAGGSLDMTGKAIGSSTNHIKTLNFRSGTLSNVGEINGGGSALTKTTADVLTISGANTYTGSTIVSEGTLVLAGSITSDVTVSSGATLGGAGSTSESILVSSGGSVAPGATGTIGTLSADSLTWDGGSTFKFQLSGASTSDRIDLTSVFSIGAGGAYTFDFLGTGIDGGVYTLLTFDSSTFTNGNQFSYTGLAGGLSGQFTLNENSLVFTAVPEPGTMALLASGLGVVLLMRRRRSAA